MQRPILGHSSSVPLAGGFASFVSVAVVAIGCGGGGICGEVVQHAGGDFDGVSRAAVEDSAVGVPPELVRLAGGGREVSVVDLEVKAGLNGLRGVAGGDGGGEP